SRKGFIITGIISIALLYGIQDLLIPKIVKFLSDYEVFFTNRIHLSFGMGTLLFFILLILSLSGIIIYSASGKEKYYKLGFYSAVILSAFAVLSALSAGGMFSRLIFLAAIIYALHKYKTRMVILHAVFMSFTVLLIGYSAFFVLV